jgi:hypothetical protein
MVRHDHTLDDQARLRYRGDALHVAVAEERLGGNLTVGLALRHEPGDFQLAAAEPEAVFAAPAGADDTPAEPPQLSRRLVGVPHRAAGRELGSLRTVESADFRTGALGRSPTRQQPYSGLRA